MVKDICDTYLSAIERAEPREQTKQQSGILTRPADYLSHVQQLIATDPNAIKWHLVMDCLNTHQSESLVRFVAQTEGLEVDLGVKGESGILALHANSV